MANDRFRTRFQSNTWVQQKNFSDSQNANATMQPLRKYDERFNAGKYKGRKASEVPSGYIKWVLANWKGLTADQEKMLKKHIK